MTKILRYIEIRRAKGVAGAILGAVCCLVLSLLYAQTSLGLVLFCLYVGVGFLKIRNTNKLTSCALEVSWSIVCFAAMIIFPFFEVFSFDLGNHMRAYTKVSVLVYNFLLLLALALLVCAVTANWRLSLSSLAGALSLLVVINGYIYRFRGKEFIFSDFLAARTAFNVAEQYNLRLNVHTVCACMLMGLLLFSATCLPTPPKTSKRKNRLFALILGCVAAGIFSYNVRNLGVITWDADGTRMNGYYMNFYLSIRDYYVEKPEGYSSAAIQQYESEYMQAETTPESTGTLPNIIVIMNESFADLRVFGSELQTNKPVTPFIDSLRENTITGYALSSVFGGTTANSEFEFLSGFSMQFMPTGSTPYQQHIVGKTHSLVWYLDSLGYHCMATHPYSSTGWSRTKIYPLLGFSESIFLEGYPKQDLIRGYVSDQEMYEHVLGQLQERREKPLFLFGITMQNHGGYTFEFTPTIALDGYSQSYPQAEQFLSLANYSDKALEYLLGELQNYPEDTVVLFFGDHLPRVDDGFFEELHGGSFSEFDDMMLKYKVPFFIWANYDIEETEVECTSLNYLAVHLLQAAGIELTPYYQFLKAMESAVPAVNAFGYYSKEQCGYQRGDAAQGLEKQWLNRYRILQYNGIFDTKNQSEFFFD